MAKMVDVSSKIPSLFWKQVSVQMILVTVLEGSFQALGSRSLIAIVHFVVVSFRCLDCPPRKMGKMNPWLRCFNCVALPCEEMPPRPDSVDAAKTQFRSVDHLGDPKKKHVVFSGKFYHLRKLTWNPKMNVWKNESPFQRDDFHVPAVIFSGSNGD